MPGSLLAVTPQKRYEIGDQNDNNENWADPRAPLDESAILVEALTMEMARVWSTRRVVRNGPGKGREQKTRRGMRRGTERETAKAMVLLNQPQGKMISLVPLLGICRWK